MDSLRDLSSNYMASQLSVDSVSEAYLLAAMHNASQLKLKCIDYITEHCTEVMATEGWKVLTGRRIELVVDILHKLALKAGK